MDNNNKFISIIPTLKELDNQPGIQVGESFQIQFHFLDNRGKPEEPNVDFTPKAVASGYTDVIFDPEFIQVDGIEYGDSFSTLQTGTIGSGIVDEVGAFSPSHAFVATEASDPVFTLNVTALKEGAPIVSTQEATDLTSEITATGSFDEQDEFTEFGTLELTFECFLTGTLIATEQGEVPVETLKIGDLVQTADGNVEKVKWVGHQTFNRGKAHPFRTYPILIKAGALGSNLPTRDLYVSPDHAILIDGLLINAGALTNDRSIIQIHPENDYFVYHHIELEHHALLMAEGTPAESYLPQNQSRDTFDNGAEYEQLYPNHNILSLLPMHYPRVSSKRQLPRFVAKRLNDIATELGYDNAQSTEQMTQMLSISA